MSLENKKKSLIKASIIHNTVKNEIINLYDNEFDYFKELTLNQLRCFIEENIKSYSNNQINFGLGFPIGLNADCIVAHFTPIKITESISTENILYYINGETQLKNIKLLKIDYGVHINGYIIDSAFTLDINKKITDNESNLNEILINSSKEAVSKVISNSGVDVRLNELSEIANEIVDSYEYNNKPIKLVENVYSHNIDRWIIHGSKFIKPDYKKNSLSIDEKMDLNEIFAIEFYTTNGRGKGELIKCEHLSSYTHYNLLENYIDSYPLFIDDKYNLLLETIQKNIYTLPFCPNFVYNYKVKVNNKKIKPNKIVKNLQELHKLGILNSYPPIIEIDNAAVVAQTEKTILVDDVINVY